MQKATYLKLAGFVAAIMMAVTAGAAFADEAVGETDAEIPETPGPALSDEQREEIRALIDEMQANNATREEIHEAVLLKYEEFGVEPPQLTPMEKRELKHMAWHLRAGGAEPDDVREELREQIADFHGQHPHQQAWNDLTPEQHQEIRNTVEQMVEDFRAENAATEG